MKDQVDVLYRFYAYLVRMLAIALAAGLGAGCSTGINFKINNPSPENYSPLLYYSWLKSAPGMDIEDERNRIMQSGQESYSTVGAVQLALIRNTSEESPDETEAAVIEMLGSVAGDDVNEGMEEEYRIFAELWLSALMQRENLKSALDGQENEVKRLQEQIEALTVIERQLIEREQSQEQQ